MFSKVYISSFSNDPASPLMWSHYADSHKGLCIAFSTSIHEDGRRFMFTKGLVKEDQNSCVFLCGQQELLNKVNYVDTMPTISFFEFLSQGSSLDI